MRIETIEGPSWAASYLINGDASGLTDEEIAQVDAWLKREGFSKHQCVSCSDVPRFTWSYGVYFPEGDCEGGEVLEYTFLIHA
ncbi:hypothetical protein HYPP_02646 [Hyphomicrobium sp. ghe19]|uniref:DUF6926 domain-containing protein n=1 Tax=Hyphomicrobium sp. ghe19 TaxID=2682968 RepID=UPI001366C2A4|nr:hypothetical protein HYPP_02646 [Hyphomicrobium sp. ghe19]